MGNDSDMPLFPECTVQQGLIHAPEYKFLSEAGHDQEEGPALGVQLVPGPKNEEDCGHRQSQERAEDSTGESSEGRTHKEPEAKTGVHSRGA